MVDITSKSISDYYSNNPSEYFVKFIHHNIIVIDESEEEYDKYINMEGINYEFFR